MAQDKRQKKNAKSKMQRQWAKANGSVESQNIRAKSKGKGKMNGYH